MFRERPGSSRLLSSLAPPCASQMPPPTLKSLCLSLSWSSVSHPGCGPPGILAPSRKTWISVTAFSKGSQMPAFKQKQLLNVLSLCKLTISYQFWILCILCIFGYFVSLQRACVNPYCLATVLGGVQPQPKCHFQRKDLAPELQVGGGISSSYQNT